MARETVPNWLSGCQGDRDADSKPGLTRTLVGSAIDVVVVVSSAVVAVVGSALEVVSKVVEVAISEANAVVDIDVASASVFEVAISISDTALEPDRKMVDDSVSSVSVDEATVETIVDSTDVMDKVVDWSDEVGKAVYSAEAVDRLSDSDDNAGLHGVEEAS